MSRLAVGGDDPFIEHLRPLFAKAEALDLLSAFIQESGLVDLQPLLFDAGSLNRVRILTGDYFNITSPRALRRLLDWTERGFECRVFETQGAQAFHPKSWRFDWPDGGVAFVGSSNVSRSALGRGIEWNLRIDKNEDLVAWARLAASFQALWIQARPLSAEWIEAYEARREVDGPERRAGQVVIGGFEPPLAIPTPTKIQYEALLALAKARDDGRKRALVVLATGLGKTWLAAFDIASVAKDLDRPPRVLFVAHREEILRQAAETLTAILTPRWPRLTVDFCLGSSDALDTDVVLGSVQKLARERWLDELSRQRWDYVVIDEVHHAAADSYRRVLSRLDAGFVLGLTATPDRQDEGDVLGLLDDHLAFRADLDRGIGEGFLSPFKYLGLRDTVDYADIPWRNRRFDPEVLAQAVQTELRMQRLWDAWSANPGTRTLVFCASIAHAQFVGRWLGARGVRLEVVHSGEGSADRELALAKLKVGALDALATVDLFNEGVDIPSVDRVAMLRPTESPILFLQQLGRGLRKSPGKTAVTVIDFVGNHKVFLDRVGRLISIGSKYPWQVLDGFLAGQQVELPPGCSVEVELEAIDLLRRLVPKGRSVIERPYRELRDGREGRLIERTYRELRDGREGRPTLGELYRLDLSPQALRATGRGWFDFVLSEGDLSKIEQSVLRESGNWLRELETSAMSKCFKAVVLEVLLDQDVLHRGMELEELAARCYPVISRSPELRADIAGVTELGADPTPEAWRRYWRKNPIRAWTGGRFFGLEEREGREWLVPRFVIGDGDEGALAAMTRELVDYRMAQYRRRLAREGEVIDLVEWRRIRAYPTLRAAAGVVADGEFGEVEADEVLVASETDWTGLDVFLVRVSGDSMDGGKRPIRDGSWVVLRPCRGVGFPSVEGKVVLLQVSDAVSGYAWQLKRVVAAQDGWTLRSDNPEHPSYAATAESEPLAVLVDTVAADRVRPDGEASPMAGL